MGYHSQVLYGIAGPKDQMIVFLTKARLADPRLAQAIAEMKLIEFGTVKEPALLLYFKEDNTKWYDSYDDVKRHMELWEMARGAYDDENFQFENLYGSFVRIGEESNDIETKDFGKDYSGDIARPSTIIESSIDFEAPDIKENLR